MYHAAYSLNDTIAAVASAAGGAARGILRLSGPQVLACLSGCFRADPPAALEGVVRPTAIAGEFRWSESSAPLPCELLLWPGRRSYTGEPAAEIHTLGSPPLLQAALAAVCRAGARLAAPGEFTFRAFLNGRIDLTQAEAVLGVIEAGDQAALETALAQAAGGLAQPLHRLRGTLLDLLVELEAALDFPEEDISPPAAEAVRRRLAESRQAAAGLLAQMATREHAAPAIRAVLIGAPNAGKSSLFNALAAGAAAIVSAHAGTTRDYLVAEIDLDGVKCQLVDTAGVESLEGGGETASELAAEGPAQAAQKLAAAQARGATVRLLCLDSTRALGDWEQAALARGDADRTILVWTKIDCTPHAPREDVRHAERDEYDDHQPLATSHYLTSAVTGQGIAELRRALRQAAFGAPTVGGTVAATADRCRDSLQRALESLDRAQELSGEGREELLAAEIRIALDELGRMVGAVYSEDVLSAIFGRFCVGK